MAVLNGFVAYSSKPKDIGQTIMAALKWIDSRYGVKGLASWEESDIAGRFIVEPILENIAAGDVLVADVTVLNFNVTFEIGYAIGKGKRVLLVSNSSLASDAATRSEVGIFDTLGYQTYQNSDELAEYLASPHELRGLSMEEPIDRRSPIYLVQPPKQTDVELRVASRVKKTRLGFRHFDPTEVPRLAAGEAIGQVTRSLGVVVPFVASHRVDAVVHNMRAAFVAGLAYGMNKATLLLQAGHDPVPLDYRDLVQVFNSLDQINDYVAEFAPQITELLHAEDDVPVHEPKNFLAGLTLGSSIAENEMRELGKYYIEKDEFRRAEHGEVQIVVGRKGAGKTALFARLRDRVRRNQQMIVLDLQPQGFQLLKMKERVLALMEEGTKGHTLAAFWEYLLLLEVAYKLLEKDRIPHTRNHELYEPYRRLESKYRGNQYTAEGDFAERMQWLVDQLVERFNSGKKNSDGLRSLSRAEVTELLYKHDVRELREEVFQYLELKAGLWILFDNLDKGWPPAGLGADDLLLIRSLLDAATNLRRSLAKKDVDCNAVVFIRNDVFELLVDYTPDRGKSAQVTIDWLDGDELREMLRRRFVFSGAKEDATFLEIWTKLCVSHVNGEESSEYLIERCLMRPRFLIDLLTACRSHAVNLGKDRIDESDFSYGEERYSTDLVHNVGYELRDVFPEGEDALYELVEAPQRLEKTELLARFGSLSLSPERCEELVKHLLWYGVIGLVREDDKVDYIYNVGYDMKRLMALVGKTLPERLRFEINPAFWAGLETKRVATR